MLKTFLHRVTDVTVSIWLSALPGGLFKMAVHKPTGDIMTAMSITYSLCSSFILNRFESGIKSSDLTLDKKAVSKCITPKSSF